MDHTNVLSKGQSRPPRPGPHQPGELHEQFAAIAKEISLKLYCPPQDHGGMWHVARMLTTAHYHRWYTRRAALAADGKLENQATDSEVPGGQR